jgi:hypothetical protein
MFQMLHQLQLSVRSLGQGHSAEGFLDLFNSNTLPSKLIFG